MEKEQDINLDDDDVQGEEAEDIDDTDQDDEFEYDDEGNIVIPDVTEDEETDGLDDDTAEEGDDDAANAAPENEDKGAAEETPVPAPEQDADKEALKREKEAAERKLEALEKQTLETLSKLGIKADSALEGLEKAAAESDDMSLEDYRKKKAEAQRNDEARRLYQQVEFEKKMKADFAEIQREYPETRSLKSLTEIENLAKFGRFRDMGLSPKEAYAAANPDSMRRSVAAATKQQSLNDTKAHLKSAVPVGSKDDGIVMSKRELAEWRDLFPHLSDKEISKLYRDSAKK